jgi:LuxR family maltose regulon positive regulatory protein
MDASVVVTKLVPPLVKKHVVRRSMLAKKLKKISQHSVTMLHAGAGYGKSTSLALFISDTSIPNCWYTVSAQDDNWNTFAAYFIHSVRTRYASFGTKALDFLSTESGYKRPDEMMTVCRLILNELASLEDVLILIIDDYHHVQHAKEVEAFVQYILEHLPSHTHLVISTRYYPAWPLLTRMKLLDQMQEITERDLQLSEEEMEVLFSDSYGLQLPPEQLKRIYESTEGWVIAIQMIWQRLLSGGDLSSLLAKPEHSMEDLFRYLALEVLRKLPEDLVTFLIRTSVLDVLNAEACGIVLGDKSGAAGLEHLYDQRLFLFSLGDGQFRYHALFRDFLLKQLLNDPARWEESHQRAATYYEGKGLYAHALHHLKELRDEQRIVSLLHRHGDEILSQGRLESMLEVLLSIKDEMKDEYPLVWHYEGEAERYGCRFERSLRCYQRAERLGVEAGDRLVQALGLKGQAHVFLDTIQPGRAEQFIDQALHLLSETMGGAADKTEKYKNQLYRLKAENLLNAGKTEEAPRWAEKSTAVREDSQSDELMARLHLRTGRLHSAKRLLEASKRYESNAELQQLSKSHRETDLLLSLVELFLGEADVAKGYAQEGMLNGVRRKTPFVEAVGWMRMGHAAQVLAGYEFHVPLECYKTALRIMDGLEVPRGKAEPLMGLCLLYGKEGDWETALEYGRQALSETERANDVWLSSLISLSMAVAAYHGDRMEQAMDLLNRVLEAFTQCGDSYGVALAYLWKSLIAYQDDQDEKFQQAMDAFLRTAQNGEYEFLFHRRTLFGPQDVHKLAPLLFEAQKRGIHKHYVKYLLSLLGIDHMEYHPGYTLRIETLGEFKVWLGDKPVTDKDWQRGKAKELFQLLITKRKQLLPREEILGALWKDADEKSASRDFKVALNALNTALEPGRKARSNPFFIGRHGTSYGVNLAAGFELDTVVFDHHVKAGLEEKEEEQAKVLLRNGLSMYRGEYLPERKYEDWCTEERERLEVLFLRGAERLAQLLMASGEYDGAMLWCERILEEDRCWEEAYRLLMMCHHRRNNRNQAVKYYQKCCEALKNELGVEPMETTRRCYEDIMHASGVTDL